MACFCWDSNRQWYAHTAQRTPVPPMSHVKNPNQPPLSTLNNLTRSYWYIIFGILRGLAKFCFSMLVTFSENVRHRRSFVLHCKEKIPKLETNIPRKGFTGPQSQFPHSFVCERFIYSHDRSASFCCRKYVDRSRDYKNRSQTHECGNWDWGRAVPKKGIFITVCISYTTEENK